MSGLARAESREDGREDRVGDILSLPRRVDDAPPLGLRSRHIEISGAHALLQGPPFVFESIPVEGHLQLLEERNLPRVALHFRTGSTQARQSDLGWDIQENSEVRTQPISRD